MESLNKKADNAPTIYLLPSCEIAMPGMGYI